jgi:hypothetical protein
VKPSHTIRPLFDDPNLVSAAGLVPALELARTAGFYDLLDALTVPSPNAAAKTASVVGGMLAGADSIDDLDLLRHGGMARLFAGVRAPSTLGTYLRSFTHGHVQQLDKLNARLLAGLAGRVPALVAGGDADGLAFVDVDDTIREVHGYAKQAAAYGYTRQRGLNIQVAAICTPLAAPVIAGARLRRGNVASASGAGQLLARAINTARAAGMTGRVLARADAGYYKHAFVAAAIRAKAWFSVTAPMNPSVVTAICEIPEQAWRPISYPNAVFDEAEQRWISQAEVAEIGYTAFIGRRKGHRKSDHVGCRLVVRRVKRLQPLAGDGTTQGELFATYRHHAFITNSTLSTVEADQRHRDHAVIEQVIAELKNGPLAHLPSGSYAANAAWVAHAAIAFNLARAVDATSPGHRRWATLRTRIINTPARIATTGRRLILHLPRDWPWAAHWQALWTATNGPPTPATS